MSVRAKLTQLDDPRAQLRQHALQLLRLTATQYLLQLRLQLQSLRHDLVIEAAARDRQGQMVRTPIAAIGHAANERPFFERFSRTVDRPLVHFRFRHQTPLRLGVRLKQFAGACQ